jgi:single-stranded-DNA-specific exonuclease
VATLAKNRGVENLNDFAKPSLERHMPDPFIFIDMEKAVVRIADAIKSGQKIAILGDYDVDGVSSIAILVKFLSAVGANFCYSVPNRMDEGYGLSIGSIEKYKDCLLVAVDCGSGSLTELAYAKEHGIDAVVIDHHKISVIPDAVAVVNPHRPDESGDYQYLCATGLVFLCVYALNRMLKLSGFYEGKKEPAISDYLDLVALASVCDVVELVGLNRVFVFAGLKLIRDRKNFGIDAILSFYRGAQIASETISFFLGPRLNAAGRMSSADISVRLLTTENPIEARKNALLLEDLNRQRQIMECEILEKANSMVDESLNFICLYHENWHAGVMGIVAGRLKEKFNKPTIVISHDKNGMGLASCRSVVDLDLSKLIAKGIQLGIISSGGGHAMAAGFSIEINKIDRLVEFLKAEIRHEILPQEAYADCILDLDMLTFDLLKAVSVLEPFGVGNRHPKFIIPNVTTSSHKIVGKNHMTMLLHDDKGNSLRTIAFKAADSNLGRVIIESQNPINALGTCVISCWKNERYLCLQLEDVSDCTPEA